MVLAYTGIVIWRNVESLFTADRGFRIGQVPFLEMVRESGIRSALGASPLRLARTDVQMGVQPYWVSRSVLLDTKPGA